MDTTPRASLSARSEMLKKMQTRPTTRRGSARWSLSWQPTCCPERCRGRPRTTKDPTRSRRARSPVRCQDVRAGPVLGKRPRAAGKSSRRDGRFEHRRPCARSRHAVGDDDIELAAGLLPGAVSASAALRCIVQTCVPLGMSSLHAPRIVGKPRRSFCVPGTTSSSPLSGVWWPLWLMRLDMRSSGMSRSCFRHVSGIYQACVGHVSGMCHAFVEDAAGMWLGCFTHVSGMPMHICTQERILVLSVVSVVNPP